jgi:hypothetical protein
MITETFTMQRPRKTQKCPPRKAWEYAEDMYFQMPAASPTDFTGLAPIVPETEYEAESYCDVMDVPVTAKDGSEKYKKIR